MSKKLLATLKQARKLAEEDVPELIDTDDKTIIAFRQNDYAQTKLISDSNYVEIIFDEDGLFLLLKVPGILADESEEALQIYWSDVSSLIFFEGNEDDRGQLVIIYQGNHRCCIYFDDDFLGRVYDFLTSSPGDEFIELLNSIIANQNDALSEVADCWPEHLFVNAEEEDGEEEEEEEEELSDDDINTINQWIEQCQDALSTIQWKTDNEEDDFLRLQEDAFDEHFNVNIFDYHDLYIKLADALCKTKQFETLFELANEMISNDRDSILHNSSILQFYSAVADACYEQSDYDSAITYMLHAIEVIDDDEIEEQARYKLSCLFDLRLKCVEPESRKQILCTSICPDEDVDSFQFASPEIIREWTSENSEIKFALGHPVEKCLYVSHPMHPDVYYEVNTFHDILFDDKRQELIHILESLGASYVRIETSFRQTKHEQKTSSRQIGTQVNAMDKGGHAQYDSSKSSARSADKFIGTLDELHLNPHPSPHLPDELYWFHHEPSWQRLAKNALEGRYKELTCELVYRDDFSVNKKKMMNFEAGLKAFEIGINAVWKKESEQNLHQFRETVWKYHAKFDTPATAMIITDTPLVIEASRETTNVLPPALPEDSGVVQTDGTTLACTACGENIGDNSKFCPECGAKVIRALSCKKCKTPLEAGMKFCAECGQKV